MQKGNTSKIPQIQNEFICYSYHKLLLYLCYALLTHIYQQKEYDVLKQKKTKNDHTNDVFVQRISY